MRPDDEALGRILDAGLRAPSAENRHYLVFGMRRDGVDLVTTDAQTWAGQPHRKMLALLSYGAVIENMQLSSNAVGLEMRVDLFPDRSRGDLVAALRWESLPGGPAADPLERFIGSRHTNRRFYRRQAVGPTVLAALSGAAAAVPGAGLAWLDGKTARRQALQAIRIAEAERFVGARLHAELFGAVRFDLGWKATSAEWLPPGTLEVEPPMRAPFAMLRHAGVMRAANWGGAHHMLGARAGYLPALSAPHLGLVLASGSEDLAAVAAGRAFERTWLAATAHGLALQPMAAATALARQDAGDGWVRPRVRQRLRQLLEALRQGGTGEAFILFRLGLAEPPSMVTGRKPWRDYVAVD